MSVYLILLFEKFLGSDHFRVAMAQGIWMFISSDNEAGNLSKILKIPFYPGKDISALWWDIANIFFDFLKQVLSWEVNPIKE